MQYNIVFEKGFSHCHIKKILVVTKHEKVIDIFGMRGIMGSRRDTQDTELNQVYLLFVFRVI